MQASASRAALPGLVLALVAGCQGVLGIDEFAESDPTATNTAGAGSEDGAGGGTGGVGGDASSGPGGAPVPQLTWGAVVSGSGHSQAGGMAVDGEGHINVCGAFTGQLKLSDASLSSSGNEDSDIYVARMPGRMKTAEPGPEEPVYVRQFGDVADQDCSGLALASDGAAWITGGLEGTVSFDADTLAGAAPRRAFAALLAPNGAARAFELGGTGQQQGRAVAAYEDGTALLVGRFTHNLDAAGQSLQTGPAGAGFAVRTDGAASSWIYGVGVSAPADQTDEEVSDAALTAQRDAILVGSHSGGAATTAGTTLAAFGAADFFVAKLDSSGTEQWVASGGGNHADAATAVAVGPADAIIVVGNFRESLSIGGGGQSWPGNSPDDSDVFVAKLAPDGEVVWVQTLVGDGDAYAWDVAVDGLENIYVVGSFQGEIRFADGTLGSADGDGFFVVLDRDGGEILTQGITGPGPVAARRIVADATTSGVVVGVQFTEWVDMMARGFHGDPAGENVLFARIDWLQ